MESLKTVILFLLILSTYRIFAQSEKDTISNVYQLGEVVIISKSEKEKIDQKQMQSLNKKDVAETLGILPSITINNVGSRNESAVYLRGFDIRSVPIYMDGIPIYIPYDGYVDLSRFTTADISKIEVSKGYSSILYGPNALGGTINMISNQPVSKFELKTKAGLLSGNGFNNFVNMGSKWEKFYLQSGFSQYDRVYLPLSHQFETNSREEDYERDNSYRKDRKFTARIGFTPNNKDEYSLSYVKHTGEKGNPIYLGTDPQNRVRYWQWPYWNKESLYFISNSKINAKMYVKSRIFYDDYKNKLMSFDHASYDSQNTNKSFTSYYKDYILGGSVEAGTDFTNQLLKIALHYKRDFHQSNDEGKKPEKMEDETYSIGIEDVVSVAGKLKLIPGLSYHTRNSLLAENSKVVNQDGSFAEFPKNKNTAFNFQLASVYNFNEIWNFNTNIAYKTRFATMKDRYSYKMGTAIPNPNLKSENALNVDLGMVYKTNKISINPEVFYSKIINTIQFVNNVEPGVAQMQNTGESQFYGTDISIRYQPISHLNTMVNYSFIKRKNLSNPEVLFTDVPEHQANIIIGFLPLKHLEFNINGTYNSDRNSTSYGIKSPEFLVFNAQISYHFKNGIRMETGINNIFDHNYTLTEGYPEAGRNLYFNLYYTFTAK